jgi:hypothetical protein
MIHVRDAMIEFLLTVTPVIECNTYPRRSCGE